MNYPCKIYDIASVKNISDTILVLDFQEHPKGMCLIGVMFNDKGIMESLCTLQLDKIKELKVVGYAYHGEEKNFSLSLKKITPFQRAKAKLLIWIDNYINHTVIDWLFNLIPLHNKYGKDTTIGKISYWIWKRTSRKFCNYAVEYYEEYGEY